MQYLLCLRQQLLQIKMDEDQRLEMDIKVFFGRKNVVVGKLYLALKVLAAALLFEMKHIVMCCMTSFVLVLMLKAMGTRLRRRDAKAARQMMVFGAIVKLHVPSHRDEEHHKGHQQGTDLKKSFFHAAKIQKTSDPKPPY